MASKATLALNEAPIFSFAHTHGKTLPPIGKNCLAVCPVFGVHYILPHHPNPPQFTDPSRRERKGMWTYRFLVSKMLTHSGMYHQVLWLNDKNAVVGMSDINPLLQKIAKVKSLKLSKTKLGVAHAGHGTSSRSGFRTWAKNSLSTTPHSW